MPDPEGERRHVFTGEIPIPQIREHLGMAASEHVEGDLLAHFERASRNRASPAHAPDLELQLARVVGEHDEPALGVGDVDGRIHHERQHFIKNLRGAEGAKAVEKRGDLAEVDDGRRVAPCEWAGLSSSRKTISASPRPSSMRSPCESTRSDVRSPLTKVP